jgi:hypothetical protein
LPKLKDFAASGKGLWRLPGRTLSILVSFRPHDDTAVPPGKTSRAGDDVLESLDFAFALLSANRRGHKLPSRNFNATEEMILSRPPFANQETAMDAKRTAEYHKRIAENHESAAGRHESAARHHRQAAKHYEQGDFERGAYHAHLALGHDLRAERHADEAARAHAEHHEESLAAE